MTGRMKSKNYTERAMAGFAIPTFCFVPRELRPGEGKLSVKISASDIIDNHKRIADADPLGWIIAVMNGQPIPHFSVEAGELKLTYCIPDMEARERAAQWLGNRVTFKAPSSYIKQRGVVTHAQDYDAMIEAAAQGEIENA